MCCGGSASDRLGGCPTGLLSHIECGNNMGKRREKTRWSQVDWIHSRRGGKLKRNSAVGPRFVKQQSNVVEQEIISEFCCVEDLPDGFTKIRLENLLL